MKRASLVVACVLLAGIDGAPAQTWPARPVTLIVPFGAGGPVDTLARALSEAMRASLGQPVLIENVTGASGTIGVGRAVRAAPDGYTVSIGNWPSHVVNGAIYQLQLRRAEGFRAGRAPAEQPLRGRRPQGPARRRPQGADRLAQGQFRQGDPGHRRPRLRPARQRRLFPEGHRHQLPVRAVSRRLLRDHARPGRPATSTSPSTRRSPRCRTSEPRA